MKKTDIVTLVIVCLFVAWVAVKMAPNATESKIPHENETIEEVTIATKKTQIMRTTESTTEYIEPDTKGVENGDFSNSIEIWVYSMDSNNGDGISDNNSIDDSSSYTSRQEEVGGEDVQSSGDMSAINDSGIVDTDSKNIGGLDGWIYINEPYQFNSTYMGVHKITDITSPQWAWLQSHDWSYTDDGICCYDDRILVALTPIFGGVGDYVDLLLEDGTILYCIIGDEKANSDTYGHWSNGYLNVIEIIVSESWYNGHENKYYPNVVAYR